MFIFLFTIYIASLVLRKDLDKNSFINLLSRDFRVQNNFQNFMYSLIKGQNKSVTCMYKKMQEKQSSSHSEHCFYHLQQ